MIGSPRCGYVAIIGRPNVGKSTLLNRLVGQKVSITASKPQTTRHSIIGISTLESAQLLFVDTPGIHTDDRRALNRYLNRAADGVLSYADVVILVTQAGSWRLDDDRVVDRLKAFSSPVIAAVNKIDKIPEKARLLPYLEELANRGVPFRAIVPTSATRGVNLDALQRSIVECLPEGEFAYPADQVTTISRRFLAAELVREKLTRMLRDELPYALTVEVETFEEQEGGVRIGAVIWVERASQKGIVIGRQGAVLREAGKQARIDMEREFECKVFLRTWVKVRSGWADDERALQSLGYRTQQQ